MIRKRVKVLFYSGGTGGEQQRAGRLCNCRGAAGQGAVGEALLPPEDQARGHDRPVPTGTLVIVRNQTNERSIIAGCQCRRSHCLHPIVDCQEHLLWVPRSLIFN